MIEIKPMDGSYLHARCLHNGPIDTTACDPPRDRLPEGSPPHPWDEPTLRQVAARYRAHGMAPHATPELMREMIHRYGTCAMLAWEAQKVVGHLRFYPMKVARLLWTSDRCPVLNCPGACEPEEDEGALWVLCVMTAQPYVASASCSALEKVSPARDAPDVVTSASGQRQYRTAEEAGARKGVGLMLVRGLISWARDHGWNRIVKVAHCDLDWHYGILGGGGKAFWEKAGFKVVGSFHRRGGEFKGDDRVIVQAQMARKGMTERELWTWYRMAYEL